MKLLVTYVFIILLSAGCAHTPLDTRPLVDTQQLADVDVMLNPSFIDKRDHRFREKFAFAHHSVLVATFGGSTAIGDKVFDQPLDRVFEQMFQACFRDHDGGLVAEITINEFAVFYRRNPAAHLPFISFLLLTMDVTWISTINVDVAVLDNEDKYALRRTYTHKHIEKMAYNAEHTETHLGMLETVFERFAQELETDLRRTRF